MRLSPARRLASASLIVTTVACGSRSRTGSEAGVDAAADAAPDSARPTGTGITITVEPDGSGVAQGLLTAIRGATTAVHVEMYLLTSDVYLDALEGLSASGVDVRVVLNQVFPAGTAASDTNARSYATLEDAGVPVRWAPTNTGFDSYTHAKAVIIDPGRPNAQVWVMTMNLDDDGPRYNREYLALDTNPDDIAEAEAIFEADYADTGITPSGNLVVAPSPQNNAAQVLLGLIESATTSLDLEAEEFDDAGLEAELFGALTAKARAGVTVRLVLEDAADAEQTSAVRELLAAGGLAAGYAYDANEESTALDIHAKAIVVDGVRAFVGSENFSGGSLGYNRELGVVFAEPAEVSKVDSAIVEDFQGGAAYSSE